MIDLNNLTPLQNRALAVPECFDLMLAGGRGGSKTITLLILAARWIKAYGKDARILYLRQNHQALSEMIDEAQILLAGIFGDDCLFNKQQQIFRFKSGSLLELNQLSDLRDYIKFQGKSYTLLLIDEVTLWSNFDLIDKVRSNLRGRIQVRVCYAGNPGGPGMGVVNSRLVKPANNSEIPFQDGSRQVVCLHSTFKDNPFLNHADYEQQLRAACRGSEALLLAWTKGDWSQVHGNFWTGSYTEANHVNWDYCDVQELENFKTYLALDHGSRAPFVCYLVAEALDNVVGPDGELYIHGSKIFLDETTSATRDALDVGGMDIPECCIEILRMCAEWNAQAKGFADDATFSNSGLGFYHEAYRDAGVVLRPAKKGHRKDGLFQMRVMFEAASAKEDPALYLDPRRCWYAVETLPVMETDPNNPEESAKSKINHAEDAIRYGVIAGHPQTVTRGPIEAAPNPLRQTRRQLSDEKVKKRLLAKGVHAYDAAAMRGGRVFAEEFIRR